MDFILHVAIAFCIALISKVVSDRALVPIFHRLNLDIFLGKCQHDDKKGSEGLFIY